MTSRSSSHDTEARSLIGAIPGFVVAHREGLLVIAILSVAALAHGVNMFEYPYYENDEGVYMAQAWSLRSAGELAPYTYWYDHAPLGWIQIAFWTILTGGFYGFGTAIDSGRVLMLVFQVASTFMVYRIARNVSGSVLAATIASLAFAFSAFGLYFHRRVLLDNIATFWMLLSILSLVGGKLSLKRVWFSAFALGVSALSKELTVFLFPVLAYMVFDRSHRSLRWFAAFGWMAIVACTVSTWALLATLKSELFPTGTFLGGTSEHVSLIETLKFQASRGKDGGLLDPSSGFWNQAASWARDEPFLVIGGTIAALLSAAFVKRYRVTGILGMATLSLWLFLGRGGIVIGFYLIPLLPLLALNAGIVLGSVAEYVKSSLAERSRLGSLTLGNAARALALAVVVTGISLGFNGAGLGYQSDRDILWTNQQTIAQKQATEWVQTNVPRESVMIIDNGVWLDLHDPADGSPAFDAAHWYWKIDLDPEIGDDVFHGDWRTADYIFETVQMQQDAHNNGLKMVTKALDNSTSVATFDVDGYSVTMRRVDKLQRHPATAATLLVNTWTDYKARFIEGGRVTDPATSQTTSEGQAYAMLRAVYMDDRATFDEVWNWTANNLQTRDDALLAWQYGELEDGSSGVLDDSSATDADQDAALALLFAAKRWDSPEYEAQALKMLDDIWNEETVVSGGERVVVAGDWVTEESPVVNPSYFAPYAYKVFAEADPSRPWRELSDSSYRMLGRIHDSPELGGEAGLVPDWVRLDPATGEPLPAGEVGSRSNDFSYDASRVPWRISLDYIWHGDERAETTLEDLYFPRRELESEGRLVSAYTPDGEPDSDHGSISMYAGTLPGLLFGGDRDLAYETYSEEILRRYTSGPTGSYWGDDPDNYYDQNMAWFATAVMDGAMSNLWEDEEVIEWHEVGMQEGCAPKCRKTSEGE